MWGKKLRFRTVANIIAELEEIRDVYGFEAVLFVDDEFTLYPKIHSLLKAMKKLNMIWRCWTRADLVNKKMLEEMNAAGCREIAFGVESGSQRILDNINKKLTVEQNLRAIEWSKESGIHTKIFLMVGCPGETIKSVWETIEFIKTSKPDDWILSTFVPIPGSETFMYPEKYGIKILSSSRTASYKNFVEAGQPDQEPIIELSTASKKDIKLFREILRLFLRKEVRHKVG